MLTAWLFPYSYSYAVAEESYCGLAESLDNSTPFAKDALDFLVSVVKVASTLYAALLLRKMGIWKAVDLLALSFFFEVPKC